MKSYPSLNVAVYDLRKRGYRLDFVYKQGFIICPSIELKERFKEMEINEVYSFPSLHNPGTMNTLYAVTTPGGIRGLVFDCISSINYKSDKFPHKESTFWQT
ncbi:MAG TPA: hypothetical protein VGD22_12845 [Sphingobacteriaceae bacterium]